MVQGGVRQSTFWIGKDWQGSQVLARQGTARPGEAGLVKAVMACPDKVCPG